jgi:hypothetical protein
MINPQNMLFGLLASLAAATAMVAPVSAQHVELQLGGRRDDGKHR